jgi:hypothetical protein
MRPKTQFMRGIGYALFYLLLSDILARSSGAWGRALGVCFLVVCVPHAIYDAWSGYRRMQLEKVSPMQDIGVRPMPRWLRLVSTTLGSSAVAVLWWHAYRSDTVGWNGTDITHGIIPFLATTATLFLLVFIIWRDRTASQNNPN